MCSQLTATAILSLKKTLTEQGVVQGNILMLKEDKSKAEELRKKLSKKKRLNFQKKVTRAPILNSFLKTDEVASVHKSPQFFMKALRVPHPVVATLVTLQASLVASNSWHTAFVQGMTDSFGT
jgi:hypothetical protein